MRKGGEGGEEGRRKREGIHTKCIVYLHKHALMKDSIVHMDTQMEKKETLKESLVISVTFKKLDYKESFLFDSCM